MKRFLLKCCVVSFAFVFYACGDGDDGSSIAIVKLDGLPIINTDACAGPYTISFQNEDGSAKILDTEATVSLQSNKTETTFYSTSSTSSCTTQITELLAPSGSTQAEFYFRHSTAETIRLTTTLQQKSASLDVTLSTFSQVAKGLMVMLTALRLQPTAVVISMSAESLPPTTALPSIALLASIAMGHSTPVLLPQEQD